MTRIIVRNQGLSSSGISGRYPLVAATVLLAGIHSFLLGLGSHIDLLLRQSQSLIPQYQLPGVRMQLCQVVHPVGRRVAVQVVLELVRS